MFIKQKCCRIYFTGFLLVIISFVTLGNLEAADQEVLILEKRMDELEVYADAIQGKMVEFSAELQIDHPAGSTQDGSLLRVELTCFDTG